MKLFLGKIKSAKVYTKRLCAVAVRRYRCAFHRDQTMNKVQLSAPTRSHSQNPPRTESPTDQLL